MIQAKNNFSSKLVVNLLFLVVCITGSFCITLKQSYALSHEWVGGSISEYGEQIWDRKNIKINNAKGQQILASDLKIIAAATTTKPIILNQVDIKGTTQDVTEYN